MPNLFIYGSCVSRDTRAFLSDDWNLIEYVARQGFVSAATGPAKLDGESKLSSTFQNLSLKNDFAGSFLRSLSEQADATDLLIMDLVDERLGVYRTPAGGYVTDSWELGESGLLEANQAGLLHIPFGTDDHFQIWARAAVSIHDAIRAAGVMSVVLAPAWAAKADNGGGGFDYRGIPADVWNNKYERYLDHLVGLGMKVIRVRDVYASTSHQWGLAPYHYSDRVYEYMRKEIMAYYAQQVPEGTTTDRGSR